MITVGPHTFTEADARSTVELGPTLIRLLSDGLPADTVAAAQPTLDRALGLATVRLHTASAATDATVPGLTADAAALLRDRLTAAGQARLAGL